MKALEIRNRFIEFFERNNHHVIPGASLLPENDPSVLFTTAGMHPLVPFLLGEPHPMGKKASRLSKMFKNRRY
ncbi:alanine--tRNA ligase-related protein [Clostridium manihotivorum]|uniref:alanine--tRNA ligase-related protein n=1 Tax=Clostridium manihotivorum TaxID=2320868 RepID=UPI0023AAEAB7|nr:alanine--tRNA ligase-related protein [Clostridium manihotivorum]